jgi:O-glycosyl hydrolase
MKKTLVMAMSLMLLFVATASGQSSTKKAGISIDSRIKYQHVTGFGGFSPSPQWSYWLGDAEMNKLFGKGDTQLGLNILRLYIANSKNGWSAGVANAKIAKRHGAFIFASPWSPPASWKSNNSDSNGGELLESHYADWANYLNDYYKYMKNQGVTIDAVSIQNEPDWNASYQSCIWTGEKMAKFLRQYGSLIECKIVAPEAIHFSKNMHEPILNDPEACAQLDIMGGHFYGWDGSSYPLAAKKGKEVWMTEFLINERQQNNNQNINWKDDGFLFARSVNDAMLANMSAWVHYSLKRYYGCLGDGTYGTTNNGITKRGYILSHYAKYVSGTTRIRHSLDDATGKLTSSAYLSVTGDSVVVMVLNPSSNTYSTTLTLPFNTMGGMQIVTTETQNVQKTSLALDEETYQPLVTVAPYSVNTYIYTKSSARTDLPDETDDGDAIFTDEFDLFGASCVPDGWRAKFEDGTRTAGNYSLGPRIMSFSAEGAMQYAFYFRTGTASNGYVSYGEDSKYRLSLAPGKYTLYYSTVGWKANPSVTAAIQTSSGTNVKTLVSTPKVSVSSNGSASRITSTTDFALDFEITTQANYLLKWTVAKASSGLSEALVGNIRLVRNNDDDTAISDIHGESSPASTLIYNLQGQRLSAPQQGINIINGKKLIVK